ncbi:cation transporter [Romboutsia maritimum]|uniref:Cation transporter n=1 Tax=Romboutsia maritimum TaxID=2020948 RepID=A0A371IV15_9FIRM|nr:cation diffusion facilitator family transporter [Romboutsia maritimum]RDY24323.1 cation transporter [Romboutsia maritimum]
MISQFLVKKIIKNSEDIQNDFVRNKYGYLAGIIGIILNFLLFSLKFSVGILTSSVAIMADAFNNFSDMASSIITIVGFKLSSIPPDKEHPFGHGRLEYISALIVAFMVMLVGIQFIKSSFKRILNPVAINFELTTFVLLLISIFIKLWLSIFNKTIGNKINSSALKATSVDALGDVITSSVVALSFLSSKFITFPIDGYAGIIVALAILYAGYSLIKETISPLLGEAPDPELVKKINKEVLSYENIQGVHDLVVHNYGIGRCMASIHAEIPANIDIVTIHDTIDNAEREISDKLKIYLVIHMDPICIENEEINSIKIQVESILQRYPIVKSMHDFRIIGHENDKNLIFDIVINHQKSNKNMYEKELKESISKSIKEINPKYKCTITIDKDFI